MNYYIITTSSDESEIGPHYPQCKGLPRGYTTRWFEGARSMTKLKNDLFPDEPPELIFELEEQAILTDVVSPSNIMAEGFLVNEKTKMLIEKFALGEHKFYPATLSNKTVQYRYFWLHFVNSDMEGVDFENSQLYHSPVAAPLRSMSKNITLPTFNIQVNNYLELLEVKKEKPFIFFEKLSLFPAFQEQHGDLFYLPSVNRIFASEKLILAVKNKKLTGLSCKPV